MFDLADGQPVNLLPGQESLNDPTFHLRKQVGSQGRNLLYFSTVGKGLNTFVTDGRNRRISVTKTTGAKNSANMQGTRKEQAQRGATKPDQADIKGKIVEYSWWLKKEGYRESTIITRTWMMKRLLALGANIFDPESVKETFARQEQWSENTKLHYTAVYSNFLKSQGLTWKPPMYKWVRKLPFIPTEAELDQLIACCGKKTATFLQLLKETAVRAGEAFQLKWVDINLERRTVRVTPEKGSNPRMFKISGKLCAMLEALPKKSKWVFGNTTLKTLRRIFYNSRKRAAEKLQNPRLLEIHFHTLRHWKATMLYHQTKDVLYVMNHLGHRSIRNTMLYIQLEQAIFKENSDEFTCKAAENAEDAESLVEAGFDYVCTTPEGVMLFRKRK